MTPSGIDPGTVRLVAQGNKKGDWCLISSSLLVTRLQIVHSVTYYLYFTEAFCILKITFVFTCNFTDGHKKSTVLPAPSFTKLTSIHSSVKCRPRFQNSFRVGQEVWDVRAHFHLRSYLKWGFKCAEFFFLIFFFAKLK